VADNPAVSAERHASRVRTNVPVAIRALRRRRSWRQDDLGRRAGLTRDAVSRAEQGELNGLTIGSLSRLVAALDATLAVEVRWHGADLDRLLDRAHALVQNAASHRLIASGWLVQPEVSFNRFGDRGRCDLLAWHPASRTVLVVEVKSRIGDLQDTLGRLDIKARLGPVLAQQAGWGRPARVVRALVLAEDRTNRRILARHASLFGLFGERGRGAIRWLRHATPPATGLIWFELTDSGHRRAVPPFERGTVHRAGSEPHVARV
jgi:transcriptional regulator with XRE-family HTH domain